MMTVAMKSVAAMPAFYEHRSVFYRQKRSCFFHPSALNVANILANTPLLIFDALTFGCRCQD